MALERSCPDLAIDAPARPLHLLLVVEKCQVGNSSKGAVLSRVMHVSCIRYQVASSVYICCTPRCMIPISKIFLYGTGRLRFKRYRSTVRETRRFQRGQMACRGNAKCYGVHGIQFSFRFQINSWGPYIVTKQTVSVVLSAVVRVVRVSNTSSASGGKAAPHVVRLLALFFGHHVYRRPVKEQAAVVGDAVIPSFFVFKFPP